MIQIGFLELDPTRRVLKIRGETIRVNARGFDLLEYLLQAGGAVVAKETLLEQVWPGLVVEESNLQVQISTIRKALGDDRELIQTVARRGYRFVVEKVIDATGVTFGAPINSKLDNLPLSVTELIGRERNIDEIDALLSVRRIVTLTGPGGIGKTRLSVQAGHRVVPYFPDGVWLVELASIATPELLAGRVASTLGMRIDRHANRHQAIAEHIGDRRLLLILDNCEHVIDEAAELVNQITKLAPSVHVLATSREALGVAGETPYIVPPLEVTPASNGRGYEASAVVLFQSRAAALVRELPTDSRSVEKMRTLCARLDGIPLAIEIAAGWFPVLGLDTLIERLDDCLRLQMAGSRSLAPRHMTLRATLDWSFRLLDEVERELACACAVFAGGFTLEAALAVCSPGQSAAVAISALSSVVRKSLIFVDMDAHGARYRLLETTRVYLLEKLRERHDWTSVCRKHAEYYSNFFKEADLDPGAEKREGHLEIYLREVDNARVAINWAFEGSTAHRLGVNLSVRVMYPMLNATMMEECAWLAERALCELDTSETTDRQLEIELLSMRAAAIGYITGPTDEVFALWQRIQATALEVGDKMAVVRSTWGLWTQKLYVGEPHASLKFATQYSQLDSLYPEAIAIIGHRTIGTSMHFCGDQFSARRHLEHVVNRYDYSLHYFPSVGSLLDQGRASQVTLTRVNLLQGRLRSALSDAEAITTQCSVDSSPLLTCYALIDMAIPVAMIMHQWEAARGFCDELRKILITHPLPIWKACNDCFSDLVDMYQSRSISRRAKLELHVDFLRRTRFAVHLSLIYRMLAERLFDDGAYADALEIIEHALADCASREESWCVPELMRMRAETIVRMGLDNAPALAEHELKKGLAMAHSQGALLWELRLAKSLSVLLADHGRAPEARLILHDVYSGFSEGFELPDLIGARVMLELLEKHQG